MDDLFDDDDFDETLNDDSNEAASDEVAFQFETVNEFVEVILAPVIQRRVNGSTGRGLAWDSEWWRYPEVHARLSALHRAFEAAYLSDDLSAMSMWWIQHCDPMMDRILDGENGPFHKYSLDGPSPIPPGLPTTPEK